MPFNFLGTMTEKDKRDLNTWVVARYKYLADIKMFYQNRAAQLRRSSGLLNKVLVSRGFNQTFKKEAMTEPKGGIRLLSDRDDRLPALLVSKVKENFRDMLQVEDEATFQMNNLCVLIEKMEDKAYMTSISEKDTKDVLVELDKLFSDPRFRDVLLAENDKYEGEARFRIDSLQPRTAYEKYLSESLKDE
jgi:RecA-family ATPase